MVSSLELEFIMVVIVYATAGQIPKSALRLIVHTKIAITYNLENTEGFVPTILILVDFYALIHKLRLAHPP
jgi:hypothetical protein